MTKQVFSIFVVLAAFTLFSVARAQWTPPPQLPPDCTDPTCPSVPVNTSSTAQTKLGNLTIAPGNLVTGTSSSLTGGNLLVNGAGGFWNGLGLFGGSLTLKNDTTLVPAWGKVLMATDTEGNSSWVATSTLGLGGSAPSSNLTLNYMILTPQTSVPTGLTCPGSPGAVWFYSVANTVTPCACARTGIGGVSGWSWKSLITGGACPAA